MSLVIVHSIHQILNSGCHGQSTILERGSALDPQLLGPLQYQFLVFFQQQKIVVELETMGVTLGIYRWICLYIYMGVSINTPIAGWCTWVNSILKWTIHRGPPMTQETSSYNHKITATAGRRLILHISVPPLHWGSQLHDHWLPLCSFLAMWRPWGQDSDVWQVFISWFSVALDPTVFYNIPINLLLLST